jgi:hypothetical protein
VQGLVAREPRVGRSRVEDRQAGVRAVRYAKRHGAVDRHDRRRVELGQGLVERRDLRPVGAVEVRRLGVQRGDRRLDHVGTGAPQLQRADERGAAVCDPARVPARAVLILERDEVAGRVHACGSPRVGEQQQREQPERFGLVGHELREQPGEADRLLAQVAPHRQLPARGAVALGVEEVDHAQDTGEALGEQLVRRHAERDRGVGDLAARAGQAPFHGLLAGQERTGDLRHRQAGDAAERERHPRLCRERGMAAGEDHAQLVVLQRGLVEVDVVAHGLMHEIGSTGGRHAVVAEPVERLAPRGRGDPGARTVRHAATVPLDRRGDERVLDGVLGEREVAAEPARDGAEHGGPLVAERLLERLHFSSS